VFYIQTANIWMAR